MMAPGRCLDRYNFVEDNKTFGPLFLTYFDSVLYLAPNGSIPIKKHSIAWNGKCKKSGTIVLMDS